MSRRVLADVDRPRAVPGRRAPASEAFVALRTASDLFGAALRDVERFDRDGCAAQAMDRYVIARRRLLDALDGFETAMTTALSEAQEATS